MNTWDHEDQCVANIEGWGVFDNSDYGVRIERVDDMSVPCPSGDGQPAFVCDADAQCFVINQAEEGSELHQRALDYVNSARRS